MSFSCGAGTSASRMAWVPSAWMCFSISVCVSVATSSLRLGDLARQSGDLVQCLRFQLDQFFEVFCLLLQRVPAVGDLLLEAVEVLLLAGEFLLLLLGRVLALLGAPLLLAQLGTRGLEF